ncbi:hypothetical protein KFE98_18840 [bacterium SCSIO 12741]|nr:hypothetical protein KFE98_18840 [bacterium SCSIO 12741]
MNRNRMKHSLFYLMFGAGVLTFTSCGGEGGNGPDHQSQAEKAQNELLDEMAEAGEDETTPTFYLPSALQIGSIFQKSGLTYVQGITNPVENAKNYSTKSSRLLNFGVYSADLAYIVLNGQSQDARDYLVAIQELSNKIGFGVVFESEDLMKRFESSLGNKDSIVNVLVDIQARTDMYVDDNNMHDVTYIIFCGAWIEGMYLGVNAEGVDNQHFISGRLVEQMTILENLIKALNSNENQSDEVKEITKELAKLDKFFNQLEENKNSQNLKSFKDYKISEEHLKQLSETIIGLREKITKV